MKKKVPARERYAAIKRKQVEAELNKPVDDKTPLFDFTAPSGMEFVLRRPNIALFQDMGTLPQAFGGKVQGTDKGAMIDAFNALSDQQKAKRIEQAATIVRFICIDPKIVENPTKDDEIAPEDVTLEDFNALCEWAVGGGDEAARLSNFHRK